MKRCHACAKDLEIRPPVGRRETCPFCGADLHCCVNCAFHEAGAYNECREPQAERVLQKDRSNFCDFFLFRDARGAPGGKSPGGSAKARIAALFKAE